MKLLRETIRRLLLQELKIEKSKRMQTDIAFKKEWAAKADQASLQTLRYIHWGTVEDIEAILKADGRSEISAAIYSPSGEVDPFRLHIQHPICGVELKGYVTMASNIDLDSGRHKDLHGGKGLDDNMKHHLKTSGIPKRGYKTSYLTRTERKPNDRGGKSPDVDSTLIYKAEDFKRKQKIDYEGYKMEWPEAILDNWKVIAIWTPDSKSPYMYRSDKKKLAELDVQRKALGLPLKIHDVG